MNVGDHVRVMFHAHSVEGVVEAVEVWEDDCKQVVVLDSRGHPSGSAGTPVVTRLDMAEAVWITQRAGLDVGGDDE